MRKFRKQVAATIAVMLVVILVVAAILPAVPTHVEAVKNRQVDGMIVWGTSGVSRMYGDLWAEQYDMSDEQSAKHEANQHLWASYHKTDGTGYGYYNYGRFRQNSYYNVADATGYAFCYDDGSSAMTSSNQMTLDAITRQLEVATTTGAPSGSGAWNAKKTTVAIWAGEDWVVRNRASSDFGFPAGGRDALERVWMGQDVEPYAPAGYSGPVDYGYFDHKFNPAPGVNATDPVGDVMHTYCDDGGSTDVDRKDEIADHEFSGHYGLQGEEVYADFDETEVTTNTRLSGNSGTSGYHHTYVHNNSYQITDAHMSGWLDSGDGHQDLTSGFAYTLDVDGIDVELTHAVNDVTDKLSGEMSLGQQAGESFGRMLGGYSYRVEYLVQDFDKIPNGSAPAVSEDADADADDGSEEQHLYEMQEITYWTGHFEPAYDDVVSDVTEYESSEDGALAGVSEWDSMVVVPERSNRQYAMHVVQTTTLVGTHIEHRESQEEGPCSTCSGSGKVTCPTCGGSGHNESSTRCSTCHGTGKHCSHCNGSNYEPCALCSGTGRYNGRTCIVCSGTGILPCLRCGGSGCAKCNNTGKTKCSTCKGGTAVPKCSECNGTGSVQVGGTCSACHGTGKIACSRCHGTGQIIQTVTEDVTIYDYSIHTVSTIHYPATYYWEKVTEQVPNRCDADLAPNAGYADSWHMHQYGGIRGFEGIGVDPPEGEGIEHAARNDELDSYVFDDPLSDSDHSEDFISVKMWYTNPDKPIMKVVSENRRVKGYVEFWKNQFDPGVQIYVFGLGPYSKAQYEDQKDEYWDDGVDITTTDAANNRYTLDENGDKVWSQRCITNNKNTAPMVGAYLAGPDLTAKEQEAFLLGQVSSPDDNVNYWDTHAGGQGTAGCIDEIARTDRIDESRQSFNTACKSACGGAKFIDIWTLLADHVPYYRGGTTVDSGEVGTSNYQHGKWYDKNTNTWIFHLMWATILNDNPNPEDDALVDTSFYTLGSVLTTYANQVVSPTGKSEPSADGAASGGGVTHTLTDVLASGPGGAGAVLGYGDVQHGFVGHISAVLSDSSQTIDYKALIGLENVSGLGVGDGSAMYTYARYGRLLQDLGLDKTDTDHAVSPRLVPGIMMSGVYIGNSALSVVWKLTLEGLKFLNPFQLLAEASTISAQAKSQMADPANSWLVGLARRNPGLQSILEEIGKIYDTLTGVEVDNYEYNAFENPGVGRKNGTVQWSVILIYMTLFIAGSLLFYNAWARSGKHWSKARTLIIRIVFIIVGVPLMGLAYTAVLNGADAVMSVTASPSSQMIAATYVDFGGWVKEGRLSPPDDGVFESEGIANSAAGHASDNSVMSVRKTAWAINKATGALPEVDMTAFAGGLTDYQTWNTLALEQRATESSWAAGLQSTKDCFGLIKTWMVGEFYYASDFEAETKVNMSSTLTDYMGRRKGGQEKEDPDFASGETPVEVDNSNTIHQMFDMTNEVEDWTSRSVADNTSIFTGTGKYATSSAEEGSESTDWHLFNIYANGTLEATPNRDVKEDTTVVYSDTHRQLDPVGLNPKLPGLSVTSKTGLSTMSMYNYLTTDFTASSLNLYSSYRNKSGYTAVSHYKVNMVGSGAMGVVLYINCFIFMFACVILGFVYAFGMFVNVLKSGFKAIGSIPGAMLGVLRSIVSFIVTVCSMIFQIIGTLLLYQVVADLLLVIVSAFETPLWEKLRGVTAEAAPGGMFAFIAKYVPGLQTSVAGYAVYLVGISVIIGLLTWKTLKYAKAFLRVHSKVTDWLYYRFMLPEHANEMLQKPERMPEEERPGLLPSPVPARVILMTSLKDLFVTAN